MSSEKADGRTVLLTGGTGFLGSHVAEALCRAGLRVRCTVRATSDTSRLSGLPVEVVETDLRSADSLGEALQGARLVVHAAGVTRARREADYFAVNAEGTERIAARAAAGGVERFVFVSSLAARGPDGARGPVSPYGASKREAERRLADAVAGSELTTRVLRPGGIYGPREKDLLPLFRLARLGILVAPPGAGRLQPVHVSDVAAAILRAIDAPGEDPGPLAVAGPAIVGWRDVASALAAAVGGRVRLLRLPGGVFRAAGAVAEAAAVATGRTPTFDRRQANDLTRLAWTCDLEPAERHLGWTPHVGLRDGIVETAEWYREAGWLKG
ncbi:MAG: NAD(P)-dependent oxidoreductase [Gemmatimonadota bacterium]|nr:NAD(P)-dependent oxidoreductase [Gemmatimonadota bacterium]